MEKPKIKAKSDKSGATVPSNQEITSNSGIAIPSPSKVSVLITNNSEGGHELLRSNGKTLSILGHKKDQLFDLESEEELQDIKKALVSKPWVVISLPKEVEQAQEVIE